MSVMEKIEIAFPDTLAEALSLMAGEATRGVPLCGGSDLMVQWESGALNIPLRAIDVKNIPELRVVEEQGDDVVIGAAVSHRTLRAHPLIRRYVPALSEAAATVGGGQIQSLGSIGGSIANASPAGDIAPGLLAGGTRVVTAGAGGEREMSLEKFLLGYRKIDLRPDELIVRFLVAKKHDSERESFRKLGPRAAQAISKVMASYRGELRGGVIHRFRVAFGSVAPTAILLPELEQRLLGRAVDDALLDEAEQAASDMVHPITDIRSTADYRKWVTGRIVRSFLEHLVM